MYFLCKHAPRNLGDVFILKKSNMLFTWNSNQLVSRVFSGNPPEEIYREYTSCFSPKTRASPENRKLFPDQAPSSFSSLESYEWRGEERKKPGAKWSWDITWPVEEEKTPKDAGIFVSVIAPTPYLAPTSQISSKTTRTHTCLCIEGVLCSLTVKEGAEIHIWAGVLCPIPWLRVF